MLYVDPNGIRLWILTDTEHRLSYHMLTRHTDVDLLWLQLFFVCVNNALKRLFTCHADLCQPGWDYFDGYCYFTISTCTTWSNAQTKCCKMGSHLVTVHNQEENVHIQHRHNGEKSWIGLNDRSVEGSFVWTKKGTSSFRFWAANQPNNNKDQDCVHTLGSNNGYTWNDISCDNCFKFTCFKGKQLNILEQKGFILSLFSVS